MLPVADVGEKEADDAAHERVYAGKSTQGKGYITSPSNGVPCVFWEHMFQEPACWQGPTASRERNCAGE